MGFDRSAINERIINAMKESAVREAALMENDLRLYGCCFTEKGRRVDPRNVMTSKPGRCTSTIIPSPEDPGPYRCEIMNPDHLGLCEAHSQGVPLLNIPPRVIKWIRPVRQTRSKI